VTTSNQASRTSIVPVTSAAMITNLSAPPGSPGSCCQGAEQRHVESHPSQCPMIYDVAAGERQTKDHDPRDQTETGCHQEVDYPSPTPTRRICVSEDTLVEYSEPMRKLGSFVICHRGDFCIAQHVPSIDNLTPVRRSRGQQRNIRGSGQSVATARLPRLPATKAQNAGGPP
jgi:hypothetical protein